MVILLRLLFGRARNLDSSTCPSAIEIAAELPGAQTDKQLGRMLGSVLRESQVGDRKVARIIFDFAS
jgi:hypothetical protein